MADLPYMDCPIIDLSLLSTPSATATQENELGKLLSALNTWGCFQLVNHGIRGEVLEEIREVSKLFFGLPVEERKKVSKTESNPEGYGSDIPENAPVQWAVRLFLTVLPKHQRQLHLWPQNPQTFRETLDEFSSKVERVHDVLLKALARCLGLKDNTFIDGYGDGGMQMLARFNYYPPCPHEELVRTTSKHADSSAATFLLQDKQVEGLEVLKDDQWFKVPIMPNAFFVNMGHKMEEMSNGALKSAVHRVVPDPNCERISIATFCGSGLDSSKLSKFETL